MYIFNYHPKTGEFLGPALADPDPMNEGNWLIPAHATDIEPPVVPAGQAAVFSEGQWQAVPDHRGEIWWRDDGRGVVIETIGDPAGEGLLPEAPVIPPNREQVNAERDRRIAAGFSFGGKVFDFDPASKQRVTGAATLAGFAVVDGAQVDDLRWANPAADFGFIAQDNTVVPMDAQTCFAFGQAAAEHETAHIFAARALKDDPEGIPADYLDDVHWPIIT